MMSLVMRSDSAVVVVVTALWSFGWSIRVIPGNGGGAVMVV